MTPSTVVDNSVTVRKTVFDLDSADRVTLVKSFIPPAPVANVQEALARLENDHARLLEVINSGLQEIEQAKVRDSQDGWYVEPEDEDDEKVLFAGTTADIAKVNAIIAPLQKIQGLTKQMPKEQKRAIKLGLYKMIKDTPALRAMVAGAVTATE